MSTEWVEVKSCAWLHEAHFYKSVLEGSGIEAVIPDEHTLSVQPLYANLLGGVRILVQSTDLDRAREALSEAAVANRDGDEASGED